MSDKIDNGGQAFPSHPMLYSSADQHEAQGMTLRDWFAGQAPVTMEDAVLVCGWVDLRDASLSTDSNRATTWAVMSMLRYEYADAMIEARKGGAA